MKIGILTSGGDCPGLNAVIRGAVLHGIKSFGHEFVGFRDGWRGVVEGDIMELPRQSVRGLAREGGTILGTSRIGPFAEGAGGSARVREVMERHEMDAIIAVGGYHVYKGVTRKFLDDLEDHPGRLATVAGMVGYPAKGGVLALVGAFFVIAAVQHQSSEADGLDGALKSLRDEPFGPALLTVVAAGLVAFGLYCFSRARHQRI